MNQLDLNIPILAGELLLIHGAEIRRVERTIERIATALGVSNSDSYVTPTGLFVTIEYEGALYTFVRSIHVRGYHMSALVDINDLSRRFCAGEVERGDMRSQLEKLRNPEPIPFRRWKMAVAAGLGGMGFAYIVGLRSPLALVYAAINGFCVSLIQEFIASRFTTSPAISIVVGSMMLTTMTLMYPNLGALDRDLVNLGGIALMLPGVALSTAIRELTQGDLLSGIARIAEAIITLTLIATGVVSAYTLYQFCGGLR